MNGDLAAGLPQVSDGDDGGQSRGQPSWWECYVIYVPGRAGLAYHILVLYCYAMVADIETYMEDVKGVIHVRPCGSRSHTSDKKMNSNT